MKHPRLTAAVSSWHRWSGLSRTDRGPGTWVHCIRLPCLDLRSFRPDLQWRSRWAVAAAAPLGTRLCNENCKWQLAPHMFSTQCVWFPVRQTMPTKTSKSSSYSWISRRSDLKGRRPGDGIRIQDTTDRCKMLLTLFAHRLSCIFVFLWRRFSRVSSTLAILNPQQQLGCRTLRFFSRPSFSHEAAGEGLEGQEILGLRLRGSVLKQKWGNVLGSAATKKHAWKL